MQPKVGGKLHLRLNTDTSPIADKYREGKLKRTLKREFKSTWYWNEYTLNPLTRIYWRASLVPAAAVIPAPIAYIKVVGAKVPSARSDIVQ